MNNVLFITYDGINDPLGQSQIAPYIEGIARRNYNFFIISFEKNRASNNYSFTNEFIFAWDKYKFTKRFFYIGKIFDYVRMLFYSLLNVKKNNISLIHSRGFISGVVALIIFKILKTKYIYDSRGLWVDERLDNNSLSKNTIFSNIIYKFLKKIERRVFSNAEHIIVLTFKVKKYLINNYNIKINKLTVIPCAADYKKFLKIKNTDEIRQKLNIPKDNYVISYNGSLTGVYQFYKMLEIFNKLNYYFKKTIFLIITNNNSYAESVVSKNYRNLKKNIRIINTSRENMPKYLSISNVDFFMINPSFARMASFPTKFSESFAMNKPVICNSGIGDIDYYMNKYNLGILINQNDKINKFYFLRTYLKIKKINNNRNKTYNLFDLKVAIKRYKRIYLKILKNENSFN